MSSESGGRREGVRKGGSEAVKRGGSEDRRGGSGVHVYIEKGAEVNLVMEEDSCEGAEATETAEVAGERETGTKTRVSFQPPTQSLKVGHNDNSEIQMYVCDIAYCILLPVCSYISI